MSDPRPDLGHLGPLDLAVSGDDQEVLREEEAVIRSRMIHACWIGAVIVLVYAFLDWQMAAGFLEPKVILGFVLLRVLCAAELMVLFALLVTRQIKAGLVLFDVGTFVVLGMLCAYIAAKMWHIVPDYYVGIAQVMMARCVLVPGGPKRAWPVCSFLLLALPLSLALFAEGGADLFSGDDLRRIVAACSGMGGFFAVGMLGSWISDRLIEQEVKHRHLGRYHMQGVIGRGGMGTVHKAWDYAVSRPCAVKIISADFLEGRDDVRERFELEALRTGRLSTSHVAQVYDFGDTLRGDLYYTMEYLPGADLQRVIDLGGPMPAGRVIHLGDQICGGLDEAHRQGLVHRDIKPANLMIVEREGDPDFVKILDFGLLKVIGVPGGSSMRELTEEAIVKMGADPTMGRTTTTHAGAVLGTPAHMAPEQIPEEEDEEGRPLVEPDARADIYAIGSVMYFMLTGTPPFNLRSEYALYNRKATSDPTPPSERAKDLIIPADLEGVIMRCLQRDPAARFATVRQLRDALMRCADVDAWSAAEARAFWEDFPARVKRGTDLSPSDRDQTPTRTLPKEPRG